MKIFGRIFIFAVMVFALYAVGMPSGLLAKDLKIATKSSGTYGPAIAPGFGCPGTGCVGDIQTCAVDEALSPVQQTFYFIRKICDDRPGSSLPLCAGRYTGYIEECSRAADEHIDDTVISREANGAFRICFDDSATGDCTGALPAGTVIAEGTTQTHSTHVSGTELLQGVSQLDTTGKKIKFLDPVDDKKKSWKKSVGKRFVIHTTAQINGGAGSTCPQIGPCGLASTGVSAK